MRRGVALHALLAACAMAFAHNLPAQEAGKNFTPRALAAAIAEGNVAFERKDYGAARNAYARVLALEPDNLMGLVNLGMVEFYSGHPDQAEELLKKAVRLRLESAPAWLT
ncbi:MAG: tetratricopeptide repeat protein, partial [Spartobacteria bacterium]